MPHPVHPTRRLLVAEIDGALDTEAAFVELFGTASYAFWLDSSRVEGTARYSFLGASDRVLRSVDGDDPFALVGRAAGVDIDLPAGFPPELACGYVGYFGYEPTPPAGGSTWLRADRFCVVDHLDRRSWVAALVEAEDGGSGRSDAQGTWLEAVVADPPPLVDSRDVPAERPAAPEPVDAERWLVRDGERYQQDIEACLSWLRAGESYEICLTNTLDLPFTGDPLAAYRRLRRSEPAPYAAYLRIGGIHILSASPERFLTVDIDGVAEGRPIKGTAPRGVNPDTDAALAKALAASEKNRAENLMIVDLTRNDLGRVCRPGTITVPRFGEVESYATVHQLVSTVRGRLADGNGAADAVRACFPPGSMTGAPKPRTMELITELERRPRGIYSGALGWFGWRGTADLAVVIRTAVLADGRAVIGAGGAIVLDSDPSDEYAEMLLKAAVPLRALAGSDAE